MKRLFIFILAAAVCLQGAYAQETYFSTEELPDLIQCLPPPPAKGSAAFKYDIKQYYWGKSQRKDSERAAMARRDGVWSYEALLTELSVPFGMPISEASTPEIWKLLVNSLATTDQMRVAPKAYYHRTRPFVYFKEKAFLEDDAQFSGEGSYPAGPGPAGRGKPGLSAGAKSRCLRQAASHPHRSASVLRKSRGFPRTARRG